MAGNAVSQVAALLNKKKKVGTPPLVARGAQADFDMMGGNYSDADPTTGYAGTPAPRPANKRFSPFDTMAQTPAGLGQFEQATENQAFQMQKDAVGMPQPERGKPNGGGALAAAVIGMVMNALEHGSGKGFADGFMGAEQQRIEQEFQTQMQKAEQQKQIRMIEAQQKLNEAKGFGDRRREMMGGQAQERQFAHDKEMQGLRNQGAIAKTTAGSDARIFDQIASLPDDVQRRTALELARSRGLISDGDYEVLSKTAGQRTSNEGLTDERAITEKETRAGKVSKLIAEGRATEARTELTNATKVLTDIKAAWYPKEMGAKIAKMEADARTDLIKANNVASRVLQKGGSGGQVTATSYFNAMNSISNAQAKVGALRAQLEANDTILQTKLAELKKPGAKPSDPTKLVEVEIAEIEDKIDANEALRAGYMEMEKRQQQRLEMLKGMKYQQDGAETPKDVKQGNVPVNLSGMIGSFGGPAGRVLGAGMEQAGRAGAGATGRGLKPGQKGKFGDLEITRVK